MKGLISLNANPSTGGVTIPPAYGGPTMPEKLAALRTLEAAATPAPWILDSPEIYTAPRDWVGEFMRVDDPRSDADAEFVVAIRNAMPALFDYIVELELRIASLEARPVSAPPTPPGGRGGLRDVDYHGHNAVAMPQLAGELATQQAHLSGDHSGCALDWCADATLLRPSAEAGIVPEDGVTP